MMDNLDSPIDRLRSEIGALQTAIDALRAQPEVQQALRDRLAEKQRELGAADGARSSGPRGPAPVESARDVNIASHLTVNNLTQIIYSNDSTGERPENLTRYLRRLAAKMQRLRLRGLGSQVDEGQGVLLPKVYVMLATSTRIDLAADQTE